MAINIEDENGEIVFKEKQSYNQENLLKKYRNDKLTQKMINGLLEKLPQRIKQLEAEKGIQEDYIEKLDKRLNQFIQIFEQRKIDPKEELNKLREKYSDDELTKKSEVISERQTFEVKDKGRIIERTSKNQFTIEELIILYASNQYNKIQAEERIAQISQEIEKAKTRIEANKQELEKVNNSIQSIEHYFKKKRLDINRLLDKQAKDRKKGKKDTGEINLK
ncbi:MAG: hypothetical protein ACOC56_04715 [Atribacterota bacterium]